MKNVSRGAIIVVISFMLVGCSIGRIKYDHSGSITEAPADAVVAIELAKAAKARADVEKAKVEKPSTERKHLTYTQLKGLSASAQTEYIQSVAMDQMAERFENMFELAVQLANKDKKTELGLLAEQYYTSQVKKTKARLGPLNFLVKGVAGSVPWIAGASVLKEGFREAGDSSVSIQTGDSSPVNANTDASTGIMVNPDDGSSVDAEFNLVDRESNLARDDGSIHDDKDFKDNKATDEAVVKDDDVIGLKPLL